MNHRKLHAQRKWSLGHYHGLGLHLLSINIINLPNSRPGAMTVIRHQNNFPPLISFSVNRICAWNYKLHCIIRVSLWLSFSSTLGSEEFSSHRFCLWYVCVNMCVAVVSCVYMCAFVHAILSMFLCLVSLAGFKALMVTWVKRRKIKY